MNHRYPKALPGAAPAPAEAPPAPPPGVTAGAPAPLPAPAPASPGPTTSRPGVRQMILRGLRSLNRGIRYRTLGPTEIEEIELKAAKEYALLDDKEKDPDTAGERLEQFRMREGIRRMLVAVTREPVPLPEAPPAPKDDADKDAPPPGIEEPLLADEALWKAIEPSDLRMVTSDWHMDKLFGAMDYSFLRGLYRLNHEPQLDVIGHIIKKERAATSG